MVRQAGRYLVDASYFGQQGDTKKEGSASR